MDAAAGGSLRDGGNAGQRNGGGGQQQQFSQHLVFSWNAGGVVAADDRKLCIDDLRK